MLQPSPVHYSFVCCVVALQPQLVPLLGKLTDQQESIYQLLANLEQKVCFSTSFKN